MAAPALVKMGIAPLAAHLFVFYYGALADVTPPTALSSYTAAGIAGSDPQRTTWIAWKLAMAGFIIPFYFALNPVLLLNVVPVGLGSILLSVGTALLCTICLSMGLQGWVLRQTGWIERGILVGAALLLIQPGIISDLLGLGCLVLVAAFQKFYVPKAVEQQLGRLVSAPTGEDLLLAGLSSFSLGLARHCPR